MRGRCKLCYWFRRDIWVGARSVIGSGEMPGSVQADGNGRGSQHLTAAGVQSWRRRPTLAGLSHRRYDTGKYLYKFNLITMY